MILGKKKACKQEQQHFAKLFSHSSRLENLHEILALLLKFIKISMAEISVQKSRRFLSKASLSRILKSIIKGGFMECKKFSLQRKIRYEVVANNHDNYTVKI